MLTAGLFVQAAHPVSGAGQDEPLKGQFLRDKRMVGGGFHANDFRTQQETVPLSVLWATTDEVLVSRRDRELDRVGNGHGKVFEHFCAELLQLDFGATYSEAFRGLKIPAFEEIQQRFAGRVIMNIHVKLWDNDLPDPMIEQIVGLIRKYAAQRHVYFMTTNDYNRISQVVKG